MDENIQPKQHEHQPTNSSPFRHHGTILNPDEYTFMDHVAEKLENVYSSLGNAARKTWEFVKDSLNVFKQDNDEDEAVKQIN